MTKGARRRISLGAVFACDEACVRIAPVALGLGAVLAFVLMALGARLARRTPIRSISTRRARRSPRPKPALRDKNLTDADLAGPARPERRARPRASGGDRRADAAARRFGQAARRAHAQSRAKPRPRPTSPPRSSRARKSGTTRSTPTCAPRAPCCWRPTTLDTRISAARRQLFARQTFARSSSVLDPRALGRRLAGGPDRRRSDAEPDRQLARRRRRTADAADQDRHCGGRARARARRRAAWVARAPGHPSRPGASAPSRLRRALAAAWIFFVLFAALPLAGLGFLASALDAVRPFRSERPGLIDAALDAARVVDRRQRAWRGMLAPGLAAWRLVADGRPPGGDPLSRRHGDRGDLGRRAADRARGRRRRLAQYRGRRAGRGRNPRFARDRLCAAPAWRAADGRRRLAANRPVGAAENARLGARRSRHPRRRADRLHRLRHLPHQPGDLSQPSSAACSIITDCIVQDGTEALLQAGGAGRSEASGDGRPAPQPLAQIVVILQGVARLAVP